MADGDDAWTYFNAMAGMQPPATPRVPMVLKTCSAKLSGSDLTYDDLCPDPWLEAQSVPDANTVQTVFGKAYWDWAQMYVREASTHKPNSFASAKAKVLWVLDVATVMSLGMVATNIPLNSRHPFFRVWDSIRGEFQGSLELMRTNLLSRYSAYPKDQRLVQAARMAPAPFMVFPLEWIHGYVRSPRDADLVYKRIYSSLTLQGGWDQFKNLLPKFYGEWQAAAAAGDAPLERGWRQWWLWCVRDGVPTDTRGEILNPLNMGAWQDTPSLSVYINTVATESASSELIRKSTSTGDTLYPNFATTFSSYDRMLSPFLGMRFDKVIQAHFTNWLQESVPRVDGNNQPLLDSHGYPFQTPATFPDVASMLKQDRAAMAAAADAAIRNPGGTFCAQQGWNGSNVAVPPVPPQAMFVAAVAGQPSALKVAQAIPTSVHIPGCSEIVGTTAAEVRKAMGPFTAATDWLASTLLKVLGAALGVGWKLPVIQQPFVRTFSTPGFRTVPDGSTVDVLTRVLSATLNLGQLAGASLCAECPQPTGAAALGPAYAGPANTPGTPEYGAALQARIIAASTPAFQKLVASPEYQAMLAKNRNAHLLYNFVHAGDPFGPVPLPSMGTSQDQLFAQRAAERAVPTSFTGRFFRSFTRTGNPIRS